MAGFNASHFPPQVSLGQVFGQVVFADVGGAQVLAGRHDIGRLTVGGNLVVAAVNGISVAQLDKAPVKRRGDCRLTGVCWHRGRCT